MIHFVHVLFLLEIGIDTQASSIVLGNVKCHGTENRIGNFLNQSLIGTIIPLMQFANSDIEDLKIVEDEPVADVATKPKSSSIHDDPAIVSAVMSSQEPQTSWSTAAAAAQPTNRSKFFDNAPVTQSNSSWSSTNTQRNFPNPIQQRRGQPMNSQRRFGGNRETFQNNGNNFDDDFDFETSNQKFTKITSEEEFNAHQQQQQQQQFNAEHEAIYDKKKSFFDNVTTDELSDNYGSMYNRSTNTETFGHQRRGNYRRPAYSNYSRQQQSNDNYHYRQNPNNGYNHRH